MATSRSIGFVHLLNLAKELSCTIDVLLSLELAWERLGPTSLPRQPIVSVKREFSRDEATGSSSRLNGRFV